MISSLSATHNAALEKAFSVPARLKIMSTLVVRGAADFSELAELLQLTRGNLSVHMKTLEDLGYVSVKKTFANNKPRTTYTITSQGKTDFRSYVAMLEAIISPVR